MQDHLNPQQIDDYCEQSLPIHELCLIEQHVAHCAACRAQIDEALNLDQEIRYFLTDLELEGLDEDNHLDSDQLIAYVDETLDEIDRGIAESHFVVCEMCAREARDLEEFKHELVLDTPTPTWVERMSWWVHAFPLRSGWKTSGLAYAGVLASVLFLLTVLIAIWRGPVREAHRPDTLHRTGNLGVPPGASAESRSSTPELVPQPTPRGEEAQSTTSTGAPASSSGGRQTMANRRLTPTTPSHQHGGKLQAARQRQLITRFSVKGLAEVAQLPPDLRRSVASAVTTGALDGADKIRPLARKVEVLLQGGTEPGAFDVLSPVGTYVADQPVTLRWRPHPEATAETTYLISVTDAHYNVIEASPPLTGTQYTLTKRLPAGVIYNWEVSTVINGRRVSAPDQTSGMVKFQVLPPERSAFVQQMRRKFQDAPLALGVLYAREGLIEEAEREFQSLAEQQPQSAVARRLWRSAQALRRRQPINSQE